MNGTRRGKEDNIKADLKEVGCKDVDWIHLAHWRALMNTVMNLWILQKAGNVTSFSRRTP
jgi:hypothetical protein